MIPLVALLVAGNALAAGASGLRGRVTDASSQPLPGVAVEVKDSRSSRAALTDSSGAYEVASLPAGTYQVSFKLPSFATTLRRGVMVGEDAVVVLDATLHLALTADVLVTARSTFRNLADLDEPANDLIGIASAASQGVIRGVQLEERPAYRVGEVLETVPGVVISQHSGEGKANQYYVRGFNIDHGTDLATTVAGVPVNLPTHAHGQGYSDLNFLIPELVGGVQYKKGPYYVEEGDFSAAGAINVNYVSLLDRPLFKLEAGADGYGRLLGAASPRVGRGRLLLAGELLHHDGPWIHPDDYRKLNLVVRYGQGDQRNGFSVTGMAYDGRWNATDQVPERAVASGTLPRFGAIDPTDGGRSHRYALSGSWRRGGARSLTEVDAYGMRYGLTLYSDFTYFLQDPVDGDQFEQQDRRWVTGLKASHRWLGDWRRHDLETVVGVQLRNDRIPTVGLYHTAARRLLQTIRQDAVTERSASPYVQTTIQWTEKLRTELGLRADFYHFDVRGGDPAGSGSAGAALASPKAGLVLGPWSRTELYANWGWGFHSNDGRALRASPLVRARGAELGVRTTALHHVHSTFTLWGLDIASELVFSGDAGTTEANRPSRRLGAEWANEVTPWPWLTFDADLAYSRARFRSAAAQGDRIPGAIEGVASAGISVEAPKGFSGGLRLRYFGPRPLIEDDSVRTKASTLFNARLGYRLTSRYRLNVDCFNLADAKVSDVDYYYVSRLPGEAPDGVTDVHTHPVERRAFRVSLAASF